MAAENGRKALSDGKGPIPHPGPHPQRGVGGGAGVWGRLFSRAHSESIAPRGAPQEGCSSRSSFQNRKCRGTSTIGLGNYEPGKSKISPSLRFCLGRGRVRTRSEGQDLKSCPELRPEARDETKRSSHGTMNKLTSHEEAESFRMAGRILPASRFEWE